jgi:hypothetical protein
MGDERAGSHCSGCASAEASLLLDTVGAVAVDSYGRAAAGVSSGGIALKVGWQALCCCDAVLFEWQWPSCVTVLGRFFGWQLQGSARWPNPGAGSDLSAAHEKPVARANSVGQS